MKTWTTHNGYRIIRVLFGRSNVFLIDTGKLKILVDTSPKLFRGKLLRNLGKLEIHHIDYLVLTHAHFDHVGNAALIQQNFGAKVIIHGSEAPFLISGTNVKIKGTLPFTRFLLKAGKNIEERLTFDPCLPDIEAGSHYDFQQENINIYLLPTPGHTPGSMSLIVDDEIAIVGDAMFGIFPEYIFPPFGDDKQQIIQCWKLLLETECRLFLPAHGTANSREQVEKSVRREA